MPGQHPTDQSFVARPQLSHAQIPLDERHALCRPDTFARRRVRQLCQVFHNPALPEPAPPFDALQVDQVYAKLSGRFLTDEKMATVQIAMVVPAGMKLARHQGDFTDQARQSMIAPLAALRIDRTLTPALSQRERG